MDKIDVDTEKIKECGDNIIKLSTELQTIFDTMFNRIHNMTRTTAEWVGDSADQFVVGADKDKGQYLEYAKEIYNYGKFLVEYAESTDDALRRVD